MVAAILFSSAFLSTENMALAAVLFIWKLDSAWVRLQPLDLRLGSPDIIRERLNLMAVMR